MTTPAASAAREFLEEVSIHPSSPEDEVKASIAADVWASIAPRLVEPLARLIEERERLAKDQERERCAKVAEERERACNITGSDSNEQLTGKRFLLQNERVLEAYKIKEQIRQGPVGGQWGHP